MRFNNRNKSNGDDGDDDEASPPHPRKVSRDSMVFNNRTNTNKTLELTLLPADEFISGCRDVLRSPVLLDKMPDLINGSCKATCK